MENINGSMAFDRFNTFQQAQFLKAGNKCSLSVRNDANIVVFIL
jgi:hypothetical protein